jgi:Ca-activated chloride channel family protein
MKRNYAKPLFLIGSLVALTCAGMAYTGKGNAPAATPGPEARAKAGLVSLTGYLTRHKVVAGGDGSVDLALTLTADRVPSPIGGDGRNVDMVIVLDRSGSMHGAKIQDAKQATLSLLASLSAGDRFALVSYSDGVQRHSALMNVTPDNRKTLEAIVRGIVASGSTNLGGGLQEGINLLVSETRTGSAGKIMLISDGLANRGITHAAALGDMASTAVGKEFSITTVGVGNDFNEQLMTTIADRGKGSYYYLETPGAFAEVFQKEFHHVKATAAQSVEVRIPLKGGISLAHAAGYPIEVKDGEAIFRPGDLVSGQSRRLFLTLRVPTHQEGDMEINGVNVRYLHDGRPFTVTLAQPFQVACVKDQREAIASIHKKAWEEKVIQEDYSRLKEEVARQIREGNEKEAMSKIEGYRSAQQAINAVVGSAAVSQNLETDLGELGKTVKDSFVGPPAEAAEKQKRNAKELQYKAYENRRGK